MSVQQEKFKEIADAIREKTGSTDLIKPSEFASKVGEVYEAGQQSEYDRFWDSLQQYGTRENYWGGFAGWRNDIFNPKYPLDNVSTCNYMFMYARVTTVPYIKCTGTALAQIFAYSYGLVTVECIELKEDGSQDMSSPFLNCYDLRNLTIKGKIGKNGFNVQWSTKLTYESLISIKNALADKSADTSGTVWEIIVGGTNKAKYTKTDLEEIRAKGWDLK